MTSNSEYTQNFGRMELFRGHYGFCGSSYRPGRIHPDRPEKLDLVVSLSSKPMASEPRQPSMYDPQFCVESEFEVGFDVAHRNRDLETHCVQNGRLVNSMYASYV